MNHRGTSPLPQSSPHIRHLEVQKMQRVEQSSLQEGREELLCFLPREGREGWDECQKLPFGMSQRTGMGRVR